MAPSDRSKQNIGAVLSGILSFIIEVLTKVKPSLQTFTDRQIS